MELIVFLAVGIAIVYALYKAYGPKKSEAPSVTEVVEKAEPVVAETQVETAVALDKPAKKPAAKKKPAVKKATTRKPKAPAKK